MYSFLDTISRSSDKLATLPSVHSTASFHVRAIIAAGAVQPTLCPVFKSLYLYLFYDRSEYRVDPETRTVRDGQFKPAAFVFDTDKIAHHIERLFPTDSGGFNRSQGARHSHFYKEVEITDIELPPT
jgi:hypothetical protein